MERLFINTERKFSYFVVCSKIMIQVTENLQKLFFKIICVSDTILTLS